jgi:hypothetical protein
MGILVWLLGTDGQDDTQHAQWVSEAVGRIVKLNPRPRLARHYRTCMGQRQLSDQIPLSKVELGLGPQAMLVAPYQVSQLKFGGPAS